MKLFIENKSEDKLIPPSFDVPLTDVSVKEGNNYEFYCKAVGNPLPVVQWFKNETCIDSFSQYEITYNNGDARLLVKGVKGSDKATYVCTAVNSLGAQSTSAELNIEGNNI